MPNLTKDRATQAAETAYLQDCHSNTMSSDEVTNLFSSLHGDVRKLITADKSARIAIGAQAGGYKFSSAGEIGLLVRAQRNRLALSQSDLAKIAKIGRRFISELESGKASLEIGKVFAICHVVGIDLHAWTGASPPVLCEKPAKTASTEAPCRTP